MTIEETIKKRHDIILEHLDGLTYTEVHMILYMLWADFVISLPKDKQKKTIDNIPAGVRIAINRLMTHDQE